MSAWLFGEICEHFEAVPSEHVIFVALALLVATAAAQRIADWRRNET